MSQFEHAEPRVIHSPKELDELPEGTVFQLVFPHRNAITQYGIRVIGGFRTTGMPGVWQGDEIIGNPLITVLLNPAQEPPAPISDSNAMIATKLEAFLGGARSSGILPHGWDILLTEIVADIRGSNTAAESACGDYPAPCNCDDPETHDA